MKPLDQMTRAEIADLERQIRFEREVRFYLRRPACLTVMSPGPPWFGAMCRKPGGHEGDHDFPTAEEATANWDDAALRSLEEREVARREAERRAEAGWVEPTS